MPQHCEYPFKVCPSGWFPERLCDCIGPPPRDAGAGWCHPSDASISDAGDALVDATDATATDAGSDAAGLCPGGAFHKADTEACAATFDGTPPSSTGFPTFSDKKGACGGYLVRSLSTMAYTYVCIYDPTTKQLAGLRFITDTPDVDTSCSGVGTALPKVCNSPSALADAGTGG